ncbi:hypothetical protein PGVV14_0013 [Preplasmiviricota sp. Gezel-14T]|uniref:hypothetical protein n=1 Tax=Preplasmiviricota sp. Gezel-14T TaxID=1335638 RepID=UPI000332AF94|nr:hypothetical protein M177_gp13 [Preplasmiviricota sp. Gezel-14T]AGM15759.1 hypothetical protein PGVV_00013 [Preplasmiviricota sp. Gezel-14T]UYE94490.1 hypothetical protein PGVV14_0013 [Preplasmiviricota sp. Gezel-14T]
MTDIWIRNGILGSKAIDNSIIGVAVGAPSRIQLTKRNATFGVDLGRNEHSGVATNITMYNNYTREEGCRMDYVVKSGRAPKEAQKVLPSYHGVARNTSSVFPRPSNDGPLLVPIDSQFQSRPNKLGLPK